MKTNKILLLIGFFALTSVLSAQIKLTTGGKASIGYAGTPPSKAQTHMVKNTMFSASSTGTGAMIKGIDGVSAANKPDYTWYTDTTTGIFHSTSGLIQFTISSGEKFRMNSSGQLLNTNSTSTAATPDYSWNGDPNTGMFNAGADLLGLSTGGTERLRINNSFQLLNKNTASTATTPDYSWSNDPNTGMFNAGADLLGFSTNGTERVRVSNNGNLLIGFTTDYGDRLAIQGGLNQTVIKSWSNNNVDYGAANVFEVNRTLTKGLVVNYNGTEKFQARADGAVYCALGYYTYSDQTLKENIDSIGSPLQKVLLLRGVKYNYKAEQLNPNAMAGTVLPTEAPTRQMGLLAQEVELIVPEVVSTTEKGIKAVAYQNLVPLLIEAIKEQNNEIQQLKTDITNCCNKRTTTGTTNRTTSNTEPEPNKQATTSWLAQNKPNPFNKETVIDYSVEEQGKGSILIFDMNGKLLKTIPVKIPGKGSVTITANDLPAGMYYYTLVVNDNEVDTKKMILTQ